MKGSRHAVTASRFPFVQVLRRERLQLGLTLYDVAADIGYHYTTIGRWERGQDYPSIAALADWCEALGLGISIGLTGAGARAERPRLPLPPDQNNAPAGFLAPRP
jgi:transcriptional regulator with XRE-family HTH domain